MDDFEARSTEEDDDFLEIGDADPVVRRVVAIDYQARGVRPDFGAELLERNGMPAGFVLLFDADHNPLDAANRFLRDHCAHDRPRTQHAYADDLAQWWRFLARIGKAWEAGDLQDIKAYRNSFYKRISRRTMRPLARATIARRVGTVELFYRWAFAEGLLKRPALPEIFEPDGPAFASTSGQWRNRRGRTVKVKKMPKDEHVRPFTMQELRKLLDELGPDPCDPLRPEGRSIRNRLMVELALYTGMRIKEVCALTRNQIESLALEMDPDDRWKGVELELTVTKGDKRRDVLIHYDEWKALIDYIEGERAAVLKEAEALAKAEGKVFRPTSALFVNGVGANHRDVGRSVKADTISRVIRKAVKACGQLRQVKVYLRDPKTGRAMVDPDSGDPITDDRELPKHSFHDLRHTFACMFYRSEIEAKRPAPLLKLKDLLGHEQLSTTTDIYLKHFKVDEAAVSDAYASYLRTELNAGD